MQNALSARLGSLARLTTVAFAVAVLAATAANACPICDSDTGLAVRAGIFSDDFWTTLLHALAPFPVLGAMVGAVHLGNREGADAKRTALRWRRRGPTR